MKELSSEAIKKARKLIAMFLFFIFSCASPAAHYATAATTTSTTCGSADIVFVIDTSPSMDDEWKSVCSSITTIVSKMQALNITVAYQIY
jgi:hypothetical protein